MTAEPRISVVFTVVGTPDGECRDVRVEAPPQAPWATVRQALGDAGHRVPVPAWNGDREIDDESPLGLIGSGAVIAPEPVAAAPGGLLRLECTTGPTVGAGQWLGRRPVTIGRSEQAALRLADPDSSRLHCRVDLTGGRVTVTDLDSTNGTFVDGHQVGVGPTEVRSGSQVQVANSAVALAGPPPPRPPVRAGRISVHRAPVRIGTPTKVRLSRPTPPRPRDRRALPWLVILLPLIIGVALAWWLGTMMFLAFALFSPVLMLAQHLADKREGRSSRRREKADHAAALVRHESKVATALTAERRLRERAAPALIEAVRSIRAVDQRLWHRHPAEYGFLHWRIGRATIASELTIIDEDGEERVEPLPQAPVVVDLAASRRVGVAAPEAVQHALLTSLVLQCAAWHSPAQLRIAVVSRRPLPQSADLGWLPHVRLPGTDTAALLDLSEPDAVTDFLRSISRSDDHERLPPNLLVVLMDAEQTTAARELAPLLEHPERFRASLVSFAVAESHLPDRAHPVVHARSGTRVVVAGTDLIECVPDLPADGLLADAARWLAPLEDAAAGELGAVPSAVGLAEAWADSCEAGLLDAEALGARWTRERRPSMGALLGAGAAGPVRVDLTVDGPHALVAGTTGAGKSELLQTLITSLAAANRPDALHLVLIDYKGGAAFRECARLPHTVGMVTDLDPHLTERALTSLGAELHRRERLLAAAGAGDLDDYHRRPSNPTIPRLVLVIDEFRVLAEELPDFVDGLVRLATVGRSLGVHLVLATQRPAGVVSADIRANVNLRIALRARDDGDSQDVIETSDAARLSAATPGRAYLRCGGGEPVLFQSARVTVPPVPTGAVLVMTADQGSPPVADGPTTLEQFVDLARQTAARLGIDSGDAPWLPPLPHCATFPDDEDRPGTTVTGLPAQGYRFALGDRPADQDQPVLGWDPSHDQHLAIVGGPRSGRTTAVRALLAAAVADGAHAYVLDLGRSLTDLQEHPCVGAVVGPDEPSRVERVLDWVAGEVADRRRRPDEENGRLLLVVDGWDVLDDLAADTALFRLLDLTSAVLRDGPAADVHVVATGGRGLLTSRSLAMFRSQIALAMADREDLAAMGVPRSAIPVDMPPGRGVTAPAGMELQVVAVDRLPRLQPRHPVHRIAPVPTVVRALPDREGELAIGADADGPAGFALGRRGEAAGLIAGPPRSGRTTALLAVAAALADRPTCWVGPDASIALPPNVFRPTGTAEAAGWLEANPDGTLLVDDVSSIADTDLEDTLVDFASRASTTGAVVFAAGEPGDLAATYRGLIGELRRRGTGVLLMPNRTDGELFALRCPKLDRPRPGNGYLVRRGELTEIQVLQAEVTPLVVDRREPSLR